MTVSSPYGKHTPWSDPGPFVEHVLSWPSDPGGLSEAIGGLVVHIRSDAGKDVRGQDRLHRDLLLRETTELLAAAGDRRSDAGLSRVGAVCRDFALLAVSAFRAHGHPARLRAGFVDYLTAGFFEDHWICEWQDGDRWRRLDVEVAADAAPWCIRFDPTDVPQERFTTAVEAWAKTRRRPAEAARYGVSALSLTGRRFIAGSVYRDAAALMRVELKPWDYWGRVLALEIDHADVDAQDVRDVDDLADALERSVIDDPLAPLPPLERWMPEGTVTGYSLGEPMTYTLPS